MNRSIAFRGLLFASLIAGMAACATESGTQTFNEIHGKTMGTTYTVKYFSFNGEDEHLKDSIDQILLAVNNAASTYLPNSLISQFNEKGIVKLPVDRDGRTIDKVDGYFMSNVYESLHIRELSDGAFDPTVAPLVNLWGFGWEGRKPEYPDSVVVDSILDLVGMQLVEVDRIGNTLEVRRTKPGVVLDFSAIAKGFAVDMVAHWLEGKAIFDYYVEIGGELKVEGNSPSGSEWILGINTPVPGAAATEIFARIKLQSRAMATSGNYRNFYEIDGVRAWHSINPISGYPESNNLLSATVVHNQCMTADALATACMIKGVKGALELIDTVRGAEAYLIYADPDGALQATYSQGFTKYLVTE